MLIKNIDDIELADILSLAENRISEGRRLEYKRDHYGRRDADKREFAADVSAMANALGGDILIGVAAENGIATEIVGIEADNADGLTRAVEQSLNSSFEPHIIGIRIRWLKLNENTSVLLIRVPRSWNAPHRVTVAGDNGFFARHENGKQPMNVEQLRRAFLFSTDVENKIKAFRSERLAILNANEGPLALAKDGPQLILHVIPLAAFSESLCIPFDDNSSGIAPFGATSGYNRMFSIDGLVTYSGPEERFETVRAFTTIFRIGVVEAVGKIYFGQRDGVQSIALDGVEDYVISAVCQILKELRRHRVAPPFYVMLSLVGVRGMSASYSHFRGGLAYLHRSDRIILPELVVEEKTAAGQPHLFLRPLFDLMWNAFGQRGSPSYEQQGICGRPHGKHFFRFERFGRLRSYVRPVDAEHIFRWP